MVIPEMNSTNESPSSRVPLVIGVTGHRDLLREEQEVIKSRVREFFTGLQAEYPELPLMVMTPLAEGADRIAAEVAHELDIPTIVLLPMPQHLYQSDFEGRSLAEFHQMRELGECIELPILPDLTEADVVEQGSGRDMQYAQLGAYLAAHSHILLAIWDGKPSDAPGGTGHVIKFHQYDVIDLIAVGQQRSPIDFTEDESDLVYHIVCSRQQDGAAAEELEPGKAHWYTRNEAEPRTAEMPERYRQVFERMAEFSDDVDSPMDSGYFYPLLPEEELQRCGRGARDIDRLYHRADFLARKYQQFFYREIWWTSILALLAGSSFVAFADLPNLELMIYPYIACILLMLLLAWLDRRFEWQRKFQDYRVLAEGLRVQFFWSVAGVAMENPSRFSHDSFMKRQDLELGWIRNVMRFSGYRADSTVREASEEFMALVEKHWVDDQHDYYRKKAEDREGPHKLTGAMGLTSFIVLLGLAIFLAVNRDLQLMTSDYLAIALMGLVPWFYATKQNYSFRMADRELLSQYQHNVRIFGNAIGLMSKARSVEMKLEILRALGEAALDEHGQWIIRQRERPTAATPSFQG